MTCVLKIFVVVGALTAGGKRCSVSAEGSNSAENGFRTLWSRNEGLLRLRTTSWKMNKCNWYMVDSCDDNEVNVTEWVYFANQKSGRSLKKAYGKFGLSNTMSWMYDNDADQSVWELAYQEPDSTCGVIKFFEMEVVYEDLKNDKEKECQAEPHAERCEGKRCNPNPDDEETYICKNGPYYDLLVTAQYKDSVPKNCTKAYEEKIGDKAETKYPDEDVKECKPREDIS